MIKAVLFDIDGVLIDSIEANWTFFQRLMTKFGYQAPTLDEYRLMFHLPMLEVIRQLAKGASEEKITEMFESGAKRAVEYPLELVKLNDGANETLKILSQKYQLGLVSSRIKEAVYGLPQLAEIRSLCQVIVTFEDTEKHKPDPEPLLLAIKQLHVAPAETVYIGDAESDFQAAQAASTHCIAFQKPELATSLHSDQLTQLPGIIDSL